VTGEPDADLVAGLGSHYASAMPTETRTVVEALAQLTLFADLTRPQLEEVAHTVGEDMFAEGQRVLRQGRAAASSSSSKARRSS